MITDNPKLLILTLHAGETEIDDCIKSIAQQDYPHVTHDIICDLPNVIAHEKLYKTIMEKSDEYDLFLKLDADMTLNHPHAISDMIAYWRDHNQPDHITFAVYDFMPDDLSIGAHLYSNNCRWETDTHDNLFPDPAPLNANRRVKVWDKPAPFINHAANPDEFSAYHFGMHRALKAFQKGRIKAHPQGLQAMRILMKTADHYKRTHNPVLKYALAGAEFVRLNRLILKSGDKDNESVHLYFEMLQEMDDTQIDALLNFWMAPFIAWAYWWCFVGWRVIIGKVIR